MCWESCPARKIPETRVVKKGKLVIGRIGPVVKASQSPTKH
jgi:hypothetical protein